MSKKRDEKSAINAKQMLIIGSTKNGMSEGAPFFAQFFQGKQKILDLYSKKEEGRR